MKFDSLYEESGPLSTYWQGKSNSIKYAKKEWAEGDKSDLSIFSYFRDNFFLEIITVDKRYISPTLLLRINHENLRFFDIEFPYKGLHYISLTLVLATRRKFAADFEQVLLM